MVIYGITVKVKRPKILVEKLLHDLNYLFGRILLDEFVTRTVVANLILPRSH